MVQRRHSLELDDHVRLELGCPAGVGEDRWLGGCGGGAARGHHHRDLGRLLVVHRIAQAQVGAGSDI